MKLLNAGLIAAVSFGAAAVVVQVADVMWVPIRIAMFGQ